MNDYKLIHFVKELSNRQNILLEFQGVITHSIETDFSNLELGTLKEIGNDEYVLKIHNLELTGKKIKLKKPLLLCKKATEDEIKIINIIEEKILFDKRPLPIVNIKLLNKAIK